MPGSREGFQAGSTAGGLKYGTGIGTPDYAVRTSKFDGGYIVEFRIPLATIDVVDGADVSPPGRGSTLRFNLAIVDNDEPVNGQQCYGVLWSEDRTKSPMLEGDGAWPVDLHLARPVKYEIVAGPKGAAIDAETGVFTWDTPKEPRTEKVTIRVRDAEMPEITAEASFTITTTSETTSSGAIHRPAPALPDQPPVPPVAKAVEPGKPIRPGPFRVATRPDRSPEVGAEELAKLRVASGMSQAVFARLLNVPTQMVQSREQGHRRQSQAALRLIQVFRHDPSGLFEVAGMAGPSLTASGGTPAEVVLQSSRS